MKTKSLHFIVPVVAAFFLSATASASGEGEKADISSFRDYEWGASYDDIFQNEVTPDMVEGYDYDIASETEDGYSMRYIWIEKGSVGGYDASVNYIFLEDKLNVAGYELDIDNEEDVNDLVDKYELVYGDAALMKNPAPGQTFAVWMDEERNMIILFLDGGDVELDEIAYIEHDSILLSQLTENLKTGYSIDLNAELNLDGELDMDKTGNTDGI